MAALSETEEEALENEVMDLIDEATGSDKMGIQDAIDTWTSLRSSLHNALSSRIQASEADLLRDDAG